MKKKINDYLITSVLIILCVWSAWNFISTGGGSSKGQGVSVEIAESVHAAFPLDLNLSEGQTQPIVLFMTSWCGACRSLEKNLKAEKVKFIAIDIEANLDGARAYRAVMAEKAGPVPVTLVGTQVFIGDRAAAIAAASKSS